MVHVQTSHQAQIHADPDLIFRLAGEVEFWPAILPWYHDVRILRRQGQKRLVYMATGGAAVPLSWTAIQWLDPAARRIAFRHVKGLTRGLEVEWQIVPRPDGSVDVNVEHRLDRSWTLVGRLAAERVVWPLFVEAIAGRTLRRIKEIAEGGSLSGRPPARCARR